MWLRRCWGPNRAPTDVHTEHDGRPAFVTERHRREFAASGVPIPVDPVYRIGSLMLPHPLELDPRPTRPRRRSSGILARPPAQPKRVEGEGTLDVVVGGSALVGSDLGLDTHAPADIVGYRRRRLEAVTAVLRRDRVLEARRCAGTESGRVSRCPVDDGEEGRHTVDDPEVRERPRPRVRYRDGDHHGVVVSGRPVGDGSREVEVDGRRTDEKRIPHVRDAEKRRRKERRRFEIQPCRARKEDEQEGDSPAMCPFDRRHGRWVLRDS